MPELTVSQLVEVINTALAPLEGVTVVGEVSGLKHWQQKFAFFDLKDQESAVNCFALLYQVRGIEDGMLVRVQAKPRLRNNGRFSLNISSIRPEGEGALKRAFELLYQKLTAEGLFAVDRKRTLPRFPEHVALITSRDAAAYSDFIKVLAARQGGLTISFLHTQVQGDEAPAQIAQALEYANTHLPDLDAIVMVRGGGSLEDLQAFNDELVVRAVATSRTPTIVGIGHERDVTLAELAADVRASTPSNAAELLVRSRTEIIGDITDLSGRLSQAVRDELQTAERLVTHEVTILRGRVAASGHTIADRILRLKSAGERLKHTARLRTERLMSYRQILAGAVRQKTQTVGQRMEQFTRVLISLSPEATLKRGYSITTTAEGRLVKRTEDTGRQATIITKLAQGTLVSQVQELRRNFTNKKTFLKP